MKDTSSGRAEADGNLNDKAAEPTASRAKPNVRRKQPKQQVTAKLKTRGSLKKSRIANDVGTQTRANAKSSQDGNAAKFPRHTVEKSLRIPRAIIDQNAGRECSDRESASFIGVGYTGPYRVELSSALKYGFLQRSKPGHISVTERARQAIRPQDQGDRIAAFRSAVLDAPEISAVYKHYRGENVPDDKFFKNALIDKFGVPDSKIQEFSDIFFGSLREAELIEDRGNKQQIIDITDGTDRPRSRFDILKKASRQASTSISTDTCFVVMPFADPIGNYYKSVYEPAILKAGLTPIRADADIFGTGKIIDQIWSGINASRVLVAELTQRNPNVFYELGLAHALDKPVVLVSSNENDVPFDLKHIRVIYYDVNDPFWGSKLIDKVAENILSALKNPEEAVFARALNAV